MAVCADMSPREHARRWLSLYLAALVAMLLVGCPKPPKVAELPAREMARGMVSGVAWGAQTAAESCADMVDQLAEAEDPRAEPLYRKCSFAWAYAKRALIVAEKAVDAWDAAHAGDVACSVAQALAAIDMIADGIAANGGHLPSDAKARIDDARKLAHALVALSGGECKVSAPMPAPVVPAPKPAPPVESVQPYAPPGSM